MLLEATQLQQGLLRPFSNRELSGDTITCRTGGRPRQGRGGRGGGRKIERPQKSAADLDAEMEVRSCCNSRLRPVY